METIVKKKKGRLNFIQNWLSKPAVSRAKRSSRENKHEKSNKSPEYIRTETKNAYLIAIRLPRVEKDSIVVKKVKSDKLQVTGKTKMYKDLTESDVEEHGKYEGMFHLTFDLASNSDKQKIEASFKNDILTIRIPKLNKAEPDGYQIKVE